MMHEPLQKREAHERASGPPPSGLRAEYAELPLTDVCGPDEPAKSAFAQTVHPLLPRESDLAPLRPGEIASCAYILLPGEEDLLLLQEPRLDPVLCRWLTAAENRFGRRAPLEAATELAQHVRATLRYSGSEVLHPFRRRAYQRLIGQEAVCLGDFIEINCGVCRHAAYLLQLGCQRCGLESHCLWGDFAEYWADSPRELISKVAHAWVAVDFKEQGLRLYDPVQGRWGVPLSGSLTVPHCERRRTLLGETIESIYLPVAYDSVYGGTGVALTRENCHRVLGGC